MRVVLGRLAKVFAKKAKRPVSQLEFKTRTFDELVEEETQPPPGKQRISSEGVGRPRFRPVA